MRTIQLNGGPFDGKRMVVPIYSAELSVPDKKSDGAFVYCPRGERTPGGLEIWDLAWASACDAAASLARGELGENCF